MSNMVRVRINTLAAGPDFTYQPGQEVLLSMETAEAWIAAGHAQRLEQETSGAATPEPQPQSAAETSSDDWTADAADEPEADPEPKEKASARPVESATGGPQRSTETDEVLLAERAGSQAAKDGKGRTTNPHDRRTNLGRAWDRGWASAQE